MECLICSSWFWPLVDAAVSMTLSVAILRVWSLHNDYSRHHVKVLPRNKRSSGSDTGDSTPPGGDWQLCPRWPAPSRNPSVGDQLAEMIQKHQKLIQPMKPRGGTIVTHSCEVPKHFDGPKTSNPQKTAYVHKQHSISFPAYDHIRAADLLSAADPSSSTSSCVCSENDSDVELPVLSTCSESSGAWELMSSCSEIHTTAHSHCHLQCQTSSDLPWMKTAKQTYNKTRRDFGVLPESSETWYCNKMGYTGKNLAENQCPSEGKISRVNIQHLADVSHENKKAIQPTEPTEAVSRRPFFKNFMQRDNTSTTKPQNFRSLSKRQNVSFRTNDNLKVKDRSVHYCYSANELLTDTRGRSTMDRRTIVQNVQIKNESIRDYEGVQHEKLREISAIASPNELPRIPYNSISWTPQESGDQESRSTYFGDLVRKLVKLLDRRPQLSFEVQSKEPETPPASEHEVFDTDLENGHPCDMTEEIEKDPVIPFSPMTHTGSPQSKQTAQHSKSLESFFAQEMKETLDCQVQRKKRLNFPGLTGLIHQSFHTYSPPALTCNVPQKIRRPAVLWVPRLSKLVFVSLEAQKHLEFHIQKITVHLKLGQPAQIQKYMEHTALPALQETNQRCLLPCQLTEALVGVSTEESSKRPQSAPSCDTKEKDMILMSPSSIVEEVHCTSPVSTFPHQLTSKEDHRRLIHILKEFLTININRLPHFTKRPVEDVPQKRQPILPKLLLTDEKKSHPVTKSVALLGANPRSHAKLKEQHLGLSSLWALSNPYMCFLAGLIPRAPAPSSPIATYNAKVEFANMKTMSQSRDEKQMFTLHTREEKQQAQSGRVITNQRSLKKLLPPHTLLAPKDQKWPEQEAVMVIGKLSFLPGEEIKSIEFRIKKGLPQTCEQPKTEQESLKLSMHHSPPAANVALTYAATAQKHSLLELGESSSSTSSLQGPVKATGSATSYSTPEVMQKMQFHLVRKSVEIRMESLPPRVKKSRDLVYLREKSLLPKPVPTDKLPLREWKKFDLCICRHSRNCIDRNIRHKQVASLFKLPTVYSESLDKMVSDSPGPPFSYEDSGDPAELSVRGPTPSILTDTQPKTTRSPATPEITLETSEVESVELNTPFITRESKSCPEIQTKEDDILQGEYSDSQLHYPNSQGMNYDSDNLNTNASCNASSLCDEPQEQVPQLTDVCFNQICRKHPLTKHLEQKPQLDALATPSDEEEFSDHSETQKSYQEMERMITHEDALENRPFSDADTARPSLEACLSATNVSVPDVEEVAIPMENAMRDEEHTKKLNNQKEAVSNQSNCNVVSGNIGSSVDQLIPNFLQLLDNFYPMPHWFKKFAMIEQSASEKPSLLMKSSQVTPTNKADAQKLIRASHMQRAGLKEAKMRTAVKAERRALTRKSEKPINGLPSEERPIPESRPEKSLRTQEEQQKSARPKERNLGTKRGHGRRGLQHEVAGEVSSVRSGSKEGKADMTTGLASEAQMHMKRRHNMWPLSKEYRDTHQRTPGSNKHSCSILAHLLK